MVYFLAPIAVEILFCFVLRHGFDRLSLTLLTTKQKRLQRKAGTWTATMRKPFAHTLTTLRQAQCDNA
jgi:hypothetical protein